MTDIERWAIICRLAPSYPWSAADIWRVTYGCTTDVEIEQYLQQMVRWLQSLDYRYIILMLDDARRRSYRPEPPSPPYEPPLRLTGLAASLSFISPKAAAGLAGAAGLLDAARRKADE